MNTTKAFKRIESDEFSFNVNISSDLHTFILNIQQEKAVNFLIENLNHNDIKISILNRIINLANRQVDIRYENPWDSALATYLWILHVCDFDLAQLGAEITLQSQKCWWASKIANLIILRNRELVSSKEASNDYSIKISDFIDIQEEIESIDTVLISNFLVKKVSCEIFQTIVSYAKSEDIHTEEIFIQKNKLEIDSAINKEVKSIELQPYY
ncbi:MAG: hypothetical protein ACFFFT_05445 [Candidatus Thorarchaeota archaeon]